MENSFKNPFKPGAGHAPPYLAGRKKEVAEFLKLLEQSCIMKNMILTGLRGVGKTVLLDTLKPEAIKAGWLWAGTDLSEAASLSEESISLRILTDLAPLVSNVKVGSEERRSIGFSGDSQEVVTFLSFEVMLGIYHATPGLPSDKLKRVLEIVWHSLAATGACKGVVLAYDEAQNLGDNKEKSAFPLSLLLDVFQSLQKKGVIFLLVFAGLPTLFPKLVEARTYAERMFHTVSLERLDDEACRDAILKPIMSSEECSVTFSERTIAQIMEKSGGYPYFIQFFCYELFDSYLQQRFSEIGDPDTAVEGVVRKLDADFFAGRWYTLTDRQRDLLNIIARLENCDEEFSVSDIRTESEKASGKVFGNSHINQMLGTLGDRGVVYKNRYGRYSLAIPLFSGFIHRMAVDEP